MFGRMYALVRRTDPWDADAPADLDADVRVCAGCRRTSLPFRTNARIIILLFLQFATCASGEAGQAVVRPVKHRAGTPKSASNTGRAERSKVAGEASCGMAEHA